MEIAFEPYKKISFQSYLCYENPEALLSVIGNANAQDIQIQLKFLWANGIVFRFFNHNPSEALSKEILSGHMIFEHIEFAPMAEFKNRLKVPDKPLVNINVIDVQKHAVFGPLSAWIHENLVKK